MSLRSPSGTVGDLRRTRRTRRLGELEWFEIAYRVYLTAIAGAFVVLWASDLVDDGPAGLAGVADVADRGPAGLGVAVAMAVAAGLRSGASGGPISIEAGDVRHLLLAPIPRRRILLLPVAQRFRALAAAGATIGGIGGLLAARRLPGSAAAWIAGGAVFGAAVATLFVAVATLAHAARLPSWMAGAIGSVTVGWQSIAAVTGTDGPVDVAGGIGLWGMRQEVVEVAAALAVVGAAAGALACAGRLRVEPLVRRADLVSQLHFAVAVQDLRTVVLLRRQLRGEHARSRPWATVRTGGSGATGAVWRRGWRSLARSPLVRLARMAGLALAAGLAALAVVDGTTPALVGVGMALFLLGLEAVEPLSQEIDHVDLLDLLPHARGWVLARHLAAPAVAVIPFAALSTIPIAVAEPEAWAAAEVLAIPITWGGTLGAAVSVVRGAPDPLSAPASGIPPEFAGLRESLRLLVPLAISALAAVPVLAVREVPTASTVARSVVALVLFAAAVVWWIRRRDELAARLQTFLGAGRTS